MIITNLLKAIGLGKTWVFSWTGYDAEEEICQEIGCGVKRKLHRMILHQFKELE